MEVNINYIFIKLGLRREVRSNTEYRWADTLTCSKDSVGISSDCVI
jgi:hypothetical protein